MLINSTRQNSIKRGVMTPIIVGTIVLGETFAFGVSTDVQTDSNESVVSMLSNFINTAQGKQQTKRAEV